jgi:hypothetical protein
MPELHFPPRTGLLAGVEFGADRENRTLLISLEGFYITTMLCPRSRPRPVFLTSFAGSRLKAVGIEFGEVSEHVVHSNDRIC